MEDLRLENLEECKYELQDEIDRLNTEKKSGKEIKKENIQILWDELDYVNSLIKYVQGLNK